MTFAGGYAFGNMEGSDTEPSGYRINGLYEYNPHEGVVSHGFSFGYISTSAELRGLPREEIKYNNWPIYYAPKFILGKGILRFYLKGALGIHISTYKRTALIETKTTNLGFYGGASAGVMLFLGQSFFLNAEYEWAYLSDSYYTNGFVNTANLGLGFKF